MANLYQSFWTKPHELGRWGVDEQVKKQVLITALSFAYAKKSGNRLVMHTDDKGAELLDFIPYDEVLLTLNDIPEDAPTCLWAQSKFYAHKASPLGAIHIDNDVFIKTEKCADDLNFDNYDLIIQNIETANGIEYETMKLTCYPYIGDIMKGKKAFGWAYCCGVVGFNNQELKDKYLDAYFTAYNRIKENPIETVEYMIPDLVLEQEVLFILAKNGNYKIKELLHNIKVDANKIGFQHILGKNKYSQMDKVEEHLRYIDSELYDKAINKINSI